MERKNIRLRRDETLRLRFLKNEYKRCILTSIFRNKMIMNTVRFYAYVQLHKKYNFMSRWKNICLLTGRAKGTTKMFNISRQMLNKVSQQGSTTGFTRNNFR